MVVRIRVHRAVAPPSKGQGDAVLLVAALLVPSALVAFTMAFWVIAADLRWTGEFFLTTGLFTHWQMWLYLAAVLLLISRMLDRWAGRGRFPRSVGDRRRFAGSIKS